MDNFPPFMKYLLLVFCLTCLSQIKWETCPPTKNLISNVEISQQLLDKTSKINPPVVCAKISVPIYWNNPNGKNITFFVKRFKAIHPKIGVLSLLEGGPGGSGQLLSEIGGKTLWERFGGTVDIIIPDHRVSFKI